VISIPIINDASNYGINLYKITQQSSHNNFSDVFLLGDYPIKMEQFSARFEGDFMGSIMGSQNIMGSDDGSNIGESILLKNRFILRC
jgi:hypothetical protein